MFWQALFCFVIFIIIPEKILNLSSKDPGKTCFYLAGHKLFDVVSVLLALGYIQYIYIYIYNLGIREGRKESVLGIKQFYKAII